MQLPEFVDVTFDLEENWNAVANHTSDMLYPVGRCIGGQTKPVKALFSLNVHPIHDLYCMAKADIFVAGASQFSALVAVTTKVRDE